MKSNVDSASVPQADDLSKVRVVVAAVASGADSSQQVSEVSGYSLRHTAYRLRAACVLGLLSEDEERYRLTRYGRGLLATGAGGEDERLLLRRAVAAAPALGFVSEHLLGQRALSREQLAERIMGLTEMAPTTALRRASTLLSWRKRLRPRQLWLSESWL